MDVTEFTVTFCNDCAPTPGTFDIEITQAKTMELLTEGLPIINEDEYNRYIKYSNIELDEYECFSITYDVRMPVATFNDPGTIVTVDKYEYDPDSEEYIPVEYAMNGHALDFTDIADATLLDGPLSQEIDELGVVVTNLSGCDISNFVGATYIVDGNFVLDLDNIDPVPACFKVENCIFLFTPGSKITVESGLVEFTDCRLSSCGEMWDGIVVESGTEFRVRNSEIENAIAGVNLQKNATADIRNTLFKNNLDGLVIDLKPGESTNLPHFLGNTFIGDGNLKPPYADTRPRTGIRADHTIISIGVNGETPNVFDDLQCGIHTTNSTLSLRNVEFKNMQTPLLGQISEGAGTGVYVRNKVNQYKWLLATGIELLRFDNCEVGIDAEATTAHIYAPDMFDVGIGIRLANCQDRAIQIRDSDINATKMGIGLIQNNPYKAYIYDNRINLKVEELVSNPTGIKIDDNSYPGNGPIHDFNDYLVRKNVINLEHRGKGIDLGTGRFIQVHDNTILMDKEENSMQGIVLNGTQNTWVRCNSIYGPMNATYGTNTIGVNGFGASGTLLNCNTTSGTRYGFHFNGMGDYVQMKGNNINDHLNGLLIKADGVIGEQDYHGNKWCGMYTDVGAKHLGTSEVVEQSPFYTDPAVTSIGGCNLIPQNQAGGDWFLLQTPSTGTSTFVCKDLNFDACGESSSPTSPGPAEEDNDIFLQSLANGTFQAERYESALEWTGRKHLYENLVRNQSVTATWEQSFVNIQQYSSVGLFAAIDANLSNLLSISQVNSTALQQIEYRQQLSLEALANMETPEAGGNYTEYEVLLDSLNQQQTEGEQIMQSIQNSRSSSLNTLKQANNFITASAIYEQNEKLFNAVFIRTIADGKLPELSTDINTLWSIANQCPLSGGDAVFKARSAYHLIDPLVAFDDDALCEQAQPLTIPTEEEPLSFKLYPNPAKDIVVVQFSEALENNAEIILVDVQGKVIMQIKTEIGQQSLLLDTSTLSPGLYFCEIKGSEAMNRTEKLVIIR